MNFLLKKKKKYSIFEAETAIPSIITQIRNVPIQADNKEEAIAQYQQQLLDGEELLNISKKASPIPGIVFLSLPILMSCFRFFKNYGIDYIELKPDLISTTISTIIYSSFVIRAKGIKNTFKGIFDTIISILIILLMAIFIKFFVGNNELFTGWFGKLLSKLNLNITKNQIIIGASILSWIGVKQISGLLWLLVIGLGLTEFASCGNYMGSLQGSFFVLSAFLGCIFYLKYEGKIIIDSLKNMTHSFNMFLKNDITISVDKTKQQIKKIKEKIQAKEISDENK